MKSPANVRLALEDAIAALELAADEADCFDRAMEEANAHLLKAKQHHSEHLKKRGGAQ